MKAAPSLPRTPPWWLRDMRHLRLAALAFALAVAASAAAVVWTRMLWHDARERQVRAAQQREVARRQFSQVEQEKRDIALYQPIYRQLLARRLVGAENRLDWLDALRQLQQQYNLPAIAYDIAPRQPVVVSPALDLGRYRLYTTRMRIQADLLHEGDLVALLSGLRTLGHSTVQDCTVKRPASAGNAPLSPTISASCTLNWVTLAQAGADGTAPLSGTQGLDGSVVGNLAGRSPEHEAAHKAAYGRSMADAGPVRALPGAAQ